MKLTFVEVIWGGGGGVRGGSSAKGLGHYFLSSKKIDISYLMIKARI